MEDPPVQIACPTCAGCGQVPFAKAHPQLARLCQRMYALAPISAVDLYQGTPDHCGVTNFNNRLEQLREYGFVERRKDGRRWLYSLTPAGEAVARQ